MAGTENSTCGTCGHAMNEHAQTGCTVAGCACKVAGDSLSSDPGSAVAWAYSRTVWRDGGYRPTGATLAVLTPGSSMELRRSKAVELAREHHCVIARWMIGSERLGCVLAFETDPLTIRTDNGC